MSIVAWAVVDKDGVPFECDNGSLAIFEAKGFAMNEYESLGCASPERVVRVEVKIQEG